jgi:phosphopantothenoylcysteine synthetase/decarboxylase
MRCIVTAGPTIEPLDEVRRLTNFSTGRLGCELAAYLTAAGHDVSLLVGEQATWRGERTATRVLDFSSTTDLLKCFQALADESATAIFHAAAVSDFTFGNIWETDAEGKRTELSGAKISSRSGNLLAELVPTPKVIAQLRDLYPGGLLCGWKYEVDGTRDEVIAKAGRQLAECRSDYCIANGAAYGAGFGILSSDGTLRPCPDRGELFAALAALLNEPRD